MAERAHLIVEGEPEPVRRAPNELAPSARPVSQTDSSLLKPQHHPRPLEVAVLIVLSGLAHGGAAYGFYSRDKAPPEARRSRVEIEFSRVEPARPRVTPPPPPPPPVEQKVKPVARSDALQPVSATPVASEAPAAAAPDSGSSAAAADDGNLVAGSGGLGLAPAAPPAPAAPSTPPPIVQAHEGANYAKNPRPAYPGRAKREGWEGQVLLRVQVQPNGRAGAMKIQRSSGRGLLDEAALDAVKSWSFVPAKQAGEAVVGWVTVPIVFRLQ